MAPAASIATSVVFWLPVPPKALLHRQLPFVSYLTNHTSVVPVAPWFASAPQPGLTPALAKSPATTTLPEGSTAIPVPPSFWAPPKLFCHRQAPAGLSL